MQKIFVKAADERLITNVYDIRGHPQTFVPARADFGAVLNYTLFASSVASCLDRRQAVRSVWHAQPNRNPRCDGGTASRRIAA